MDREKVLDMEICPVCGQEVYTPLLWDVKDKIKEYREQKKRQVNKNGKSK